MTTLFALRIVSALIAVLLFFPADASARGAVLITHGDTIAHLGDIPAQPGQPASTVKVGFKSSYFGLFWIDLWTWGGEFCLYEDNTYQSIDRATAARMLGKSESELKEPFLYRYPLGLLIVGSLLAGFVALLILGAIVESAEKKKAARLRLDPMYEKAFEIASAPPIQNTPANQPEPSPNAASAAEPDKSGSSGPAFDAGVRYLTDSGVTKEEAVRNLQLLIRHPPAKQQNG